MSSSSTQLSRAWHDLLDAQCGVVSRPQALDCGISPGRIEARLKGGHWQGVHRGVYAVFTGQLGFEQRVWAAVLACGPGAMASHRSAGLLDGLIDVERQELGRPIDLVVPRSRRVVAPQGVRVHYREHAASHRHPVRLPPRTRVEETVLDLWESTARLDPAFALLAAACQRRLTTPARLLQAASTRRRLRGRRLLESALVDVDAGVHSLLERLYLDDVERAHGLPRGSRQRIITRTRRYYSDVTYLRYATRLELDGRAWHPDRVGDRRRDNAAVLAGQLPLSYGWPEVTGTPCQTALEVAELLLRNGWTGTPKPCGPRCLLAPGSSAQAS